MRDADGPACIFCNLISGDALARIVQRDATTFAFFPPDQAVRGHTVVAPLQHVETWPELAEPLVRDLFRATHDVSRLLCSRLGASAVNVLFAGGPDAQQSVGHFHVHVLPRWRGDGIDAWPDLPGYRGDAHADFRAMTVGGDRR